MTRRIIALLIAIVVIALVLGRHYHQALRSSTPRGFMLLPITLPGEPRPVAGASYGAERLAGIMGRIMGGYSGAIREVKEDTGGAPVHRYLESA